MAPLQREQLALAEDSIPCVWKNRPAVLVCLRCGGPYCDKYRAKPRKKQFYFCRRCQSRLYNRRSFAWLLDMFLFYMAFLVVPLALVAGLNAAGVVDVNSGIIAGIYYGLTAFSWIGFALRDRLLGDAGLGKRLFGLKVVRTSDGASRHSYGQAFVRWLPIFHSDLRSVRLFGSAPRPADVPLWRPLGGNPRHRHGTLAQRGPSPDPGTAVPKEGGSAAKSDTDTDVDIRPDCRITAARNDSALLRGLKGSRRLLKSDR